MTTSIGGIDDVVVVDALGDVTTSLVICAMVEFIFYISESLEEKLRQLGFIHLASNESKTVLRMI